MLSFFNAGTTAVSFHKDGKVPFPSLRLKIYVNNGIRMSEQPLIIHDEMPSKPTHLDGLRRFIAPLTSGAEMRAVG
jgi:hypothetical protein